MVKPVTLGFNLEEQRFEGPVGDLVELLGQRWDHAADLVRLPWIGCWLHPDDVYAMLTAQAVSEFRAATVSLRMGYYMARRRVHATFFRAAGRMLVCIERTGSGDPQAVEA